MLPKSLLRQAALLTCLLALTSCGTRIGPRTASGTYLNLSGEVVSAYADSLTVTVRAGLQVLASLKVPVHFRRADSGRALIMATAPDGSPLQLQFVEEGRALTTVKIRSGASGYWRHEFSYYLHVLIDERLKRDQSVREDAVPDGQIAVALDESPGKASETLSSPSARPRRTKSIHGRADEAMDHNGHSIGDEQPEKPAVVSLPSPALAPETPKEEPEVRIYFELDSNFPKSGEMAKLDRIAQQLFTNPSWTVSLEGFAEAKENGGHPRMVAESRILSIKYYLIGKGVDGRRLNLTAIDTTGKRPNHGAPDRRRVDIWLQRTP